MEKRINIKVIVAIVVTLLLASIGMTACGVDATVPPDMSIKDPGANETEGYQETPKVGDIVEDITNPTTKARAYEQIEEVSNNPNFPYDKLLGRLIVEYKGKKVEMPLTSGVIEFSPDGKYLLYVASSASKNEVGTYLYSIESGKTQELIPSMPYDESTYVPYPPSRFMPYTEGPKWGNGTITYDVKGKTWTLKYKEE